MPMDDIAWSKRTLAVLIEEGMLDELAAGVATDWANGRSIVQTALGRNISERTVSSYRQKIRVTYDRVAVYTELPPRRVK